MTAIISMGLIIPDQMMFKEGIKRVLTHQFYESFTVYQTDNPFYAGMCRYMHEVLQSHDPSTFIRVTRGIHRSTAYDPSVHPSLFWFNIRVIDQYMDQFDNDIHVYVQYSDKYDRPLHVLPDKYGNPILPRGIGRWNLAYFTT